MLQSLSETVRILTTFSFSFKHSLCRGSGEEGGKKLIAKANMVYSPRWKTRVCVHVCVVGECGWKGVPTDMQLH